ncbi:membrane protein, putative [Lunatimonas lonarensis]|uniref:Membrane protein, putative n=1 Tax=Lunatimonas lonarensis TaxID=1232681 RepID=R7ZUC5_9BACT|nr:ABC transporter permease [Lunatimonas lonarensis]EON77750.1 membrane protein, putative [Lunatimonas lonarensis]
MGNKILLVIKREYLARVKKRSFIVATILTPLIFPSILGVFLWLGLSDSPGEQARIIEVVDENGTFYLESNEMFVFSYIGKGIEEAKASMRANSRFGVLYIPKISVDRPVQVSFFAEETPSLSILKSLESLIKSKVEEKKLQDSGIDPLVLERLKTSVSVTSIRLEQSGSEKISNSMVNYGIGFITGILIYTFIFVYGNQIMQGVIEEKSSRIIEILVSSLKPFQLMLGKIVGIGAVGLTQFMIWIVLITVVSSLVMGYFGMRMPQQQLMELSNPEATEWINDNAEIVSMLGVLQDINFTLLVVTFIIYFVGGYLLYGAFFAAIGAAVDSPSDAQQFMFPVTIPLLIAYMGLFIFVLDDPNSKISYWLSIIPFTSPVAMMGRVSFGVPFIQLAISISLLVVGFLTTTWAAGKIYRIGILIHGSKVSYKTLWRWIREN